MVMPSAVVRVKRWVAFGGFAEGEAKASADAAPVIAPAGALAADGFTAFDWSGLEPVATCCPPPPELPMAQPARGPATRATANAIPRVRVRVRWCLATIVRRASGVAGDPMAAMSSGGWGGCSSMPVQSPEGR